MTFGHDKFYDGRTEAFNKLLETITKGGRFKTCLEDYPDLSFESLKSEAEAAVKEAKQSTRLETNFKLALYRSLRYSVATSKFCLVLGAVNGLRELYEGIRLLHPLEEIKKQ